MLFSLYLSLFWKLRDKRNFKKNCNFDPKASVPCLNIDISSMTYSRKMQTRDAVVCLHNFREFSHSPEFLENCGNTEKVCFCNIFLKNTREYKTSQGVYIISSKYTYRPMRARVVSQVFYNAHDITYLHDESVGLCSLAR